jgi:hypothetical protein
MQVGRVAPFSFRTNFLSRYVPVARAMLSIAVMVLIAGGSRAGENMNIAQLVVAPPMAMPGYLEPVKDPVFATPFVRVTDPGRTLLRGISCAPKLCRHRYSSAQAWNADQSLLVITKGCPGLCFLDGQTFKPLFARKLTGACEWHPIDPERMICVSETAVYQYWVRRDETNQIFAAGDLRGLRFGPGKGNLSKDGNRLVIRALDPAGKLIAFAYDIPTATRFPDIPLDRLKGTNSYCSISPSGSYVFCYQKRINIAYVFDVNGTLIQHWPERHRPGHGDMMIDVDGSDVYIGISKSNPDKYQVIKRRLKDGAVTILTSRCIAQHASVRSIRKPGWVFLTFGGELDRVAGTKELPFYQEIVAVRTDGSGEMRRIVQTRSVPHGYNSEAHGSPSPDGSMVIWASNWGEAGGPIASYVARISWPD